MEAGRSIVAEGEDPSDLKSITMDDEIDGMLDDVTFEDDGWMPPEEAFIQSGIDWGEPQIPEDDSWREASEADWPEEAGNADEDEQGTAGGRWNQGRRSTQFATPLDRAVTLTIWGGLREGNAPWPPGELPIWRPSKRAVAEREAADEERRAAAERPEAPAETRLLYNPDAAGRLTRGYIE